MSLGGVDSSCIIPINTIWDDSTPSDRHLMIILYPQSYRIDIGSKYLHRPDLSISLHGHRNRRLYGLYEFADYSRHLPPSLACDARYVPSTVVSPQHNVRMHGS